jgi:hypothetical protein
MTPAPERAGSVPGVDKEADSPRDARLCAHCPRREQPHAAAIVRIARRGACCDGNAYGGTLDRDERECATPCRRRPAPRARFRRRRRVICAGLGAVEAGDGNRARCSAGRAASRPFGRLAQAIISARRAESPPVLRQNPQISILERRDRSIRRQTENLRLVEGRGTASPDVALAGSQWSDEGGWRVRGLGWTCSLVRR